ncbi:MAG: NAD-dependent epimerase/dehydratase family protein, partial [Pseudomonadota bacterium]
RRGHRRAETVEIRGGVALRHHLAGRAFREDDPLGGADPYSASKAACEMVAKSYAASYFDRLGAPVATARGGNVIGGGDFGAHRLGPDCVRAALAGEPVRLRQPEATRPWQHVLDCLCGYLLYAEALALRPEATPRALNVGPAPKPEVTVREFADRMLAAMGADGGVLAAEEPGSVEAKRLAIDPGLARRTLGWRDHLVGDAAIASAADWYAAWRRGDDMQLRALGEIAVYQGATPPRPGARGAASAGAARAR